MTASMQVIHTSHAKLKSTNQSRVATPSLTKEIQMQILNTLTNRYYDNEYLFLTPTNYGIDDLVAIASQDNQDNQATEHALDELHNRGITKFSQLLNIDLTYDTDAIQRNINNHF